MPFNYTKYQQKCSSMTTEQLNKEWENYTRQISSGATGTTTSVLAAPFTAGISLVGLGVSAPQIHNARKKREIIEAALQNQGTTHHTRTRDVVGAMALTGSIGGLTMGLVPSGGDVLVLNGVEIAVAQTLDSSAAAMINTREQKKLESKPQNSRPQQQQQQPQQQPQQQGILAGNSGRPVMHTSQTWPQPLPTPKGGPQSTPFMDENSVLMVPPEYQEQSIDPITGQNVNTTYVVTAPAKVNQQELGLEDYAVYQVQTVLDDQNRPTASTNRAPIQQMQSTQTSSIYCPPTSAPGSFASPQIPPESPVSPSGPLENEQEKLHLRMQVLQLEIEKRQLEMRLAVQNSIPQIQPKSSPQFAATIYQRNMTATPELMSYSPAPEQKPVFPPRSITLPTRLEQRPTTTVKEITEEPQQMPPPYTPSYNQTYAQTYTQAYNTTYYPQPPPSPQLATPPATYTQNAPMSNIPPTNNVSYFPNNPNMYPILTPSYPTSNAVSSNLSTDTNNKRSSVYSSQNIRLQSQNLIKGMSKSWKWGGDKKEMTNEPQYAPVAVPNAWERAKH